MSESTLYRKVGRRYVEVGRDWVGFPSNGVWLVADGAQSLIMKVGDVLDPAPLAALARHRMTASDNLIGLFEHYNGREDGPTTHEMVDVVYKSTCKAEEERLAKERVATGTIRQVHDENGEMVPLNRTSSVSAWMEGRKMEILTERMASLERKAEFNYYLARDDHDCSVSWEMLTEEQRNVYRKQVGR